MTVAPGGAEQIVPVWQCWYCVNCVISLSVSTSPFWYLVTVTVSVLSVSRPLLSVLWVVCVEVVLCPWPSGVAFPCVPLLSPPCGFGE
jgi:hypothetical protein